MSSAVAEPEAAVEPKTIRKPEDRGLLILHGADVTEQALVEEYYEYRNLPNQGPGPLDYAILKMLVVHQNRRKAKAEKKVK